MKPVIPSRGTLEPTVFAFDGGFWGERQELNRSAILPHAHEWIERVGCLDNFRGKPFRGPLFADSDVYKHFEGLAWETGRRPDATFEAWMEEIGALAAANQDADGYLNTRYRDARYSDLEWGHELYSYGHLIQAAVARLRTHGEDELTQVARRAADHVCRQFARDGVCGHPEIELALVELYRATGAERYLHTAKAFVDRRGGPALRDTPRGRAYFQDEQPLRAAKAFRGHAVRALYLACGAVDVAVETGDEELLAAIIAQWEHTIARRTYVTGGMGSRHSDEDFGEDFELPSDRAYSETCAGVASVMLCWRLLLATGEARFADQAERTLYNVVATSPAQDGRAFFYANPLHQRVPGEIPPTDRESPRAGTSTRAPWFTVSCCPTNIGRTLASLSGYLATSRDGTLQIHQYANGTIDDVRVTTDYPWAGAVTVQADRERTISLRVPAWARGATLNGEPVAPGSVTTRGREWRLDLPMTPRWTRPDPRVDAIRGCVAAERGPLVYCLESIDQQHDDLDGVRVDASAPPSEEMTAPGEFLFVSEDATLQFSPYHSWGNRGPSTMRVWTPHT
jgi:DUF1680 family protein